jgi:hypothetical protein
VRGYAPVVALVVLAAPGVARAGPPSSDVDDLFSYFGIEARGFGGVVNGFTDAVVAGGDLHVVVAGAPFGVLFGVRFGSNFTDTQFALADLSARYFVLPQHDVLFVGGGVFYGADFTQSLDVVTGAIGGFFAEAGVELPRRYQVRVVASVRVDFGFAGRANDPKLEPPSFTPMATFNLGVLFGGKGTTIRSER